MKMPQTLLFFLQLPTEEAFEELSRISHKMHQFIPLQGFNYNNPNDRLLSCCAEMLLRWKQAEMNINVFNRPFSISENGKPYLLKAPYFNISHSGNEILVGISEFEYL